ncbi:MAG: hypothetical protein QOI63_39 [Thermoplasmata archaeon]|nr:hypothetical protein [Thermoplasmata archaeon]
MAATAAPVPRRGFPLWGLILIALLFAAAGAIGMMTFYGLSPRTGIIGGLIGGAFVLAFELALRHKD